MKAKDLKYGVLYVEGRYRTLVYLLDPERAYGQRGGYLPGTTTWDAGFYARQTDSKRTHVLVLRARDWQDVGPEFPGNGADYTSEDYEEGKKPPRGWHVGLATTAQILDTKEGHDARMEREYAAAIARTEANKQKRASMAEEFEGLAKAMAHIRRLEIPERRVYLSEGAVKLTFDEVRTLMGLV